MNTITNPEMTTATILKTWMPTVSIPKELGITNRGFSTDKTLGMIADLMKGNTGYDKGKLTLRQLDRVVNHVTTDGMIIKNPVYNDNVPHYVKALIIIDGILKPMNKEVQGGYQNARLSYIPKSGLTRYYACRDAAKCLYSDDSVMIANYGALMYFNWTQSLKD